MTVQTLLSRLDGVRPTGPASWSARCPTREDRTPSLAIRETDDGRVLFHDFGGDDPQEILNAIGLTFADLYPQKALTTTAIGRQRMPFTYADALRCVAFEATLVAVAAENQVQGVPLTDADRERLWLAAGRINTALEVCKCR